MKLKLFYAIITAFLIFSCEEPIEKSDFEKLNGYWEIKEVTKANGKNIEYKFNELVDYINLKGDRGMRTKVQPSLDGDFKTTRQAERFSIEENNGQFIFHYTTAHDEWEETLINLEEDTFTVTNDKEITYTYQRFKGYLDGAE